MPLRRRRRGERVKLVPDEEFRAEVFSDEFVDASRRDLVQREEIIGSLRARRLELGLTQAEVGKRMRTTQSVVSELESAETDPRLSTLQKYARAVGQILTFDSTSSVNEVRDTSSRLGVTIEHTKVSSGVFPEISSTTLGSLSLVIRPTVLDGGRVLVSGVNG